MSREGEHQTFTHISVERNNSTTKIMMTCKMKRASSRILRATPSSLLNSLALTLNLSNHTITMLSKHLRPATMNVLTPPYATPPLMISLATLQECSRRSTKSKLMTGLNNNKHTRTHTMTSSLYLRWPYCPRRCLPSSTMMIHPDTRRCHQHR
jgi:hypothetical protein